MVVVVVVLEIAFIMLYQVTKVMCWVLGRVLMCYGLGKVPMKDINQCSSTGGD